MTEISTIENKIASAKKYLKILDRYKKYSKKEIEENIDLRGTVERHLYLAVQSAIDLGEAVISLKEFRKPSSMSEIFSVLNEEGVINKDLSEELSKMVGFRNIIVHDYEKINYDILYDILKNKLKDIEEFLLEIKKNLNFWTKMRLNAWFEKIL